MSLRWLALGLLLLGLGCAADGGSGGARGAVRSLDLDHWRRAEVEGFSLYSDAEPAEARRLAARLGAFVQVVHKVMGEQHFPPELRREVFLFATEEQFAWFRLAPGVTGQALAGYASVSAGLSAERVEAASTLFHELVHVALQESPTFAYPSWYHEGLAEMLSATALREDVVTLGGVPPERLSYLARYEALPLADLLSAPGPFSFGNQEDALRFYADSWALVRFLHGGLGRGRPNHYREMLAYLVRLNTATSWRQAFRDSFHVPLAELEQEFVAFRGTVATGVSPVLHLVLPSDPERVAFEPVPAAEVALRLADWAVRLGDPSLALALSDEALARDPASIPARTGRAVALAGLGRVKEAEQEVLAIPAAERRRPEVLEAAGDVQLAAAALVEEQDADAASARLQAAADRYRQALEADPERAASWARLADALSRDPDADPTEGLAALEQSGRLSSATMRHDRDQQLVRAVLLMRLGHEAEARALLERLRESTHEPGRLARIEELLSVIDHSAVVQATDDPAA